MKKKRRERETIKESKSFLPALALTVVWWGMLGGLVMFVDPQVVANFPWRGSYGIFFLLIFLAVWFLASLILGNARRGGLVALGVVIFGYFRLWGVGSILNGLLLIGTLAAFEVYFSKQNRN